MPRMSSRIQKNKERNTSQDVLPANVVAQIRRPYYRPLPDPSVPDIKDKNEVKAKKKLRFTVDLERSPDNPPITDATETSHETDEPSLVKIVYIRDTKRDVTFPFTVTGPENVKLSDKVNRKGNTSRPPNSFMVMNAANVQRLRDALLAYQNESGEKATSFRGQELCVLQAEIWWLLKQELTTLSVFEECAKVLKEQHKQKHPDWRFRPQRGSKTGRQQNKEEDCYSTAGDVESIQGRRYDSPESVDSATLQMQQSTQLDEQADQMVGRQQLHYAQIGGPSGDSMPEQPITTFAWRYDNGQGYSRGSRLATAARKAKNNNIPVPFSSLGVPQTAAYPSLPPIAHSYGSTQAHALPEWRNLSGLSLNEGFIYGNNHAALTQLQGHSSITSSTASTPYTKEEVYSDEYWSTVIDPSLVDNVGTA